MNHPNHGSYVHFGSTRLWPVALRGSVKFASAFTLIELLVVLSIISILIAILLPALQKSREATKKITCATTMRGIAQAFTMYANDCKGILPGGENGNLDPVWIIALVGYPAPIGGNYYRGGYLPAGANGTYVIGPIQNPLWCPANIDSTNQSYGPVVGVSWLASSYTLSAGGMLGTAARFVKLDEIIRPIATPMVAETWNSSGVYACYAGYGPAAWNGNHSFGLYDDVHSERGAGTGGSNLAYVDGHVNFRPYGFAGVYGSWTTWYATMSLAGVR